MSELTPHSFAVILAGLRGNTTEKQKSLQMLAEILIFADPETIEIFPLPEFSFTLLSMLENHLPDSVLILTLQCINSLLPLHFAASLLFMRFGLLNHLDTILKSTESPEAAANAFRILSFFAHDTPAIVAQSIDLRVFGKYIPILSRVDQRECITLLARIVSEVPPSSLIELIPFLSEMIRNEDQFIKSKSLSIFSTIMSAASTVASPNLPTLASAIDIPEQIIQIICEQLEKETDLEIFTNLAHLLKCVAENQRNIQFVYKYLPDLTTLLFSFDDSKSESYILEILKLILPPPKLPKELWNYPNCNYQLTDISNKSSYDKRLNKDKSSKSGKKKHSHKKRHHSHKNENEDQEILNTILPVVIIYLAEKSNNIRSCLQILAAIATLTPIDCDSAILNILMHRIYNTKCAPYVIVIASNIMNKSDVIRSGLWRIISTVKIPRTMKSFCTQHINTLKEQCKPFAYTIPSNILRSKNIEEIFQYVEKEKLFPFEFYDSKLMEKSITLIKENLLLPQNQQKCTNFSKETLHFFEEIGIHALDFLQYPKYGIKSDTHIMSKQSIKLSISGPNGSLSECQLPIHSDFMMLEGWYNLKYNSGCIERLMSAIEDNPLLQAMIKIDEDLSKSHMRFALLNRAFQTDRYIKCSFRVGNHIFSAFDNLTYMFSQVNGIKQQFLFFPHFDVAIIHDDVPRSKFKVREMNDKTANTVFHFIRIIQYLKYFQNGRKFSNCNSDFEFDDQNYMRNEKFTKYVFSKLDNPLLTLTLLSPSVQMMYNAPFLFTFDQRYFLFKTVGLDSVFGLLNIHNHFPKESDKKCKTRLSYIKCEIERDATFEHGCFLLSRIGCGRFRTEFVFNNDVGFGEGPTQEFFSIMSREFCKRHSNMWMDDKTVDSEFCVSNTENGLLFPSVNADNGLLEILGILCSKAIEMDKIIDIPFNPAFFKLILKKKVSLEEIDPMLANSLKYTEGLLDLPFVYPGTKTELVKGGSSKYVTPETVKEYVDLVTDFTCGNQMINKLSHFVKTFEMNIPLDSLSIFTPNEIVNVICGQEKHIMKNELYQFAKLEHGYDINSREIKDLFGIIEEMNTEEQRLLIKFITGCSRLPYGGLENLKPKLTIAKRVTEQNGIQGTHPDESLPSVMTCTNYFKLPPYSSKEIMREKIIMAINECQDTFLLS